MLWTNHEIEQRFSELNYPRSEIIEFVKQLRDNGKRTLENVCREKEARIAELEANVEYYKEMMREANKLDDQRVTRIAELEQRIVGLEASRADYAKDARYWEEKYDRLRKFCLVAREHFQEMQHKVAELEQALAEMQVYCAQCLAPEVARRELAEQRIAELEATVESQGEYISELEKT